MFERTTYFFMHGHLMVSTEMCSCKLDQRWDTRRRKFLVLTQVPLFVPYMDLDQIVDLFS